eukprot:PhF_6_TR40057/c0_g1_i2/m.59429
MATSQFRPPPPPMSLPPPRDGIPSLIRNPNDDVYVMSVCAPVVPTAIFERAWFTALYSTMCPMTLFMDVCICRQGHILQQLKALEIEKVPSLWYIILCDVSTYPLCLGTVVYGGKARRLIRESYGLLGEGWEDYAVMVCCSSCALAQQHTQLTREGARLNNMCFMK